MEDREQKSQIIIQKKNRVKDNEDTRLELPLGEVRISVRNLVEFVFRHGDIDNRYQQAPDNAMQEGGRIHRMIQRKMGNE